VKATPLGIHNRRAVRDLLLTHGWERGKADAAASGIAGAAVHVSGLTGDALERLIGYAGPKLGLDVLTGEDWAIVAGSMARLSAFARPWSGPPELAEVATAAGRALASDVPKHWQTARGPVPLERPVMMGILNLTPDSFSDGGRYATPEAAISRAERLVEDGAAIIDLGGESTRPGRPEPVPVDEELRRVIPVVESLTERHPDLMLSVDTVKAPVAKSALEAGAAIVNDVSALRMDPDMAGVVADGKAGVILMHSRGTVSDMATYDHAHYGEDVVGTVLEELGEALERAAKAGIAMERIVVDPGFGFAKNEDHNLRLLDQLSALKILGRPILVGPSRKRFLGAVTGREVGQRDIATAAACALAYERGARLFRVHKPSITRDALQVAHAMDTGVA
jgi:dihydropteroate synthase